MSVPELSRVKEPIQLYRNKRMERGSVAALLRAIEENPDIAVNLESLWIGEVHLSWTRMETTEEMEARLKSVELQDQTKKDREKREYERLHKIYGAQDG